jgi:hypothetical protein
MAVGVSGASSASRGFGRIWVLGSDGGCFGAIGLRVKFGAFVASYALGPSLAVYACPLSAFSSSAFWYRHSGAGLLAQLAHSARLVPLRLSFVWGLGMIWGRRATLDMGGCACAGVVLANAACWSLWRAAMGAGCSGGFRHSSPWRIWGTWRPWVGSSPRSVAGCGNWGALVPSFTPPSLWCRIVGPQLSVSWRLDLTELGAPCLLGPRFGDSAVLSALVLDVQGACVCCWYSLPFSCLCGRVVLTEDGEQAPGDVGLKVHEFDAHGSGLSAWAEFCGGVLSSCVVAIVSPLLSAGVWCASGSWLRLWPNLDCARAFWIPDCLGEFWAFDYVGAPVLRAALVLGLVGLDGVWGSVLAGSNSGAPFFWHVRGGSLASSASW